MTAQTEHPLDAGRAGNPKRAWYRLHLSTWVATLLSAALWMAVILAGERRELPERVEHGWPLCFLTRVRTPLTLEQYYALDPYVHTRLPPAPKLWSLDGRIQDFHALRLAFDVALAMLGLGFLTACLERRRRRSSRFWQLSLRELAVGTLLVASLCAWWGSLYRAARRQAHTLEALQRLLAQAPAGDGISSTLWPSESHVQWQGKGDWFLELFWDEQTKPRWFAEVVSVRLIVEQDSADAALALVGQLPSQEELSIDVYGGSRRLSEQSVQTVAELSRLRALTISRMGGNWDMSVIGLNDAQVAYLARLTNLQTLDLSNNFITDEGLRHLRALKRLETLEISQNPITNVGVDDLTRHIPGLMVLDD